MVSGRFSRCIWWMRSLVSLPMDMLESTLLPLLGVDELPLYLEVIVLCIKINMMAALDASWWLLGLGGSLLVFV